MTFIMRSTRTLPNGLIVTRHLTRDSFQEGLRRPAPRPAGPRPASPRPPFEDLRPEQLAGDADGYDLVEPKHDGWWATVHVAAGEARVVSRKGRDVARLPVPDGVSAVLCAEYLVGTQRAARSPLHGQLVVFDCLEAGGRDLRGLALEQRRAAAAAVVAALGAPFHLVEQRPASDAAEMWRQVEAGTLEGVVLKDSRAPWGDAWARVKPHVDADYVCLGVTRGADGHVRSLVAGARVRGRLRPVCRVAGLARHERRALEAAPEAFVGRVFTAVGRERLRSGALRHGTFERWRDDKPAGECRA